MPANILGKNNTYKHLKNRVWQ